MCFRGAVPWLPSDSQEGAWPPSRGYEPALKSCLLTEVSVPGDAAWYCALTTLARALAQYLLAFPKLPGHLRLPPEKERDTVKFVVTTLEVMGSLNLAFLCTGQGASCVSPYSGLTTSKRWAVVPTLQMRGSGPAQFHDLPGFPQLRLSSPCIQTPGWLAAGPRLRFSHSRGQAGGCGC